MTTLEQQKQGRELVNTLVQKSWEDTNFKKQLIKSPVATIESVLGQKIPSDTKIIVEDQTDVSNIYLNIPRKFELDELELSDEQLEMVAGGTDVFIGIGVGIVVGALIVALK